MKNAEFRKPPRPTPAPPALIDAQQRYSIPEAAAILRQSKPLTYRLIGEGRLCAFKDRGRTYVHGSELIRASAPPESSAA